jgi:hypothetical protein
MKTLMLLCLWMVSAPVWAQVSSQQIQYWASSPAGIACGPTSIALLTTSGTLYTCQSGVYAASGGALPDIPTATVLGRTTAGTGAAQALTMLPSGLTYPTPTVTGQASFASGSDSAPAIKLGSTQTGI